MKVPGLSGTWQQRNAQLYKKLGSPMGAYTGSLAQNSYLLQQLSKNNYFQGGMPGSTSKTSAKKASTSLARKYTDPLTGSIIAASEIPQFQNMMPFYEAWGRVAPGAQLAAEQSINPEAARTFRSNYNDYMSGMVNAGGQRFGAGLSGIGALKADAERNRLANIQDWLGLQRQGFEDLWYNPSMEAWNTSRTQIQPGKTMEAVKIPTWEDYTSTYNTPAYGEGQSTSPFYG